MDTVFPAADLKMGVGVGLSLCIARPVHLFTRYFWLDTQETDNVAAPGKGSGHLEGSEENFLVSADFKKHEHLFNCVN